MVMTYRAASLFSMVLLVAICETVDYFSLHLFRLCFVCPTQAQIAQAITKFSSKSSVEVFIEIIEYLMAISPYFPIK